jgi:hypothetical protein
MILAKRQARRATSSSLNAGLALTPNRFSDELSSKVARPSSPLTARLTVPPPIHNWPSALAVHALTPYDDVWKGHHERNP